MAVGGDYTKPGEPQDPNKDMMIGGSGTYAVMPNPADGSVWFTVNVFGGKGGVVRFDPKTQTFTQFRVPPGANPQYTHCLLYTSRCV